MEGEITGILGVVHSDNARWMRTAATPKQFVMQRPDGAEAADGHVPERHDVRRRVRQSGKLRSPSSWSTRTITHKGLEAAPGTASKNLQTSTTSAADARTPIATAGHGATSRCSFQRFGRAADKWVAISALINFVRLTYRATAAAVKILLNHDRQRIGDRKHEHQPKALPGASQRRNRSIDQYWHGQLTAPVFKVYAIGDMYSPKNVSFAGRQRYQTCASLPVRHQSDSRAAG